MKDFLQYVLDEVKSKRLNKTDAIDLIRQFESNAINVKQDYLHPLLHKNTSGFSEQRFSSTFTGQEFFFADHIINGCKVLPEAAYIEMAVKAVEQASALTNDGTTALLKNVVWTAPLVVGEEPVNVSVGLIPEDSGEIDFKIYSDIDVNKEEVVIHNQGKIIFTEPGEAQKLNIEVIQEHCSRSLIMSDLFYAKYKHTGIDCGLAYKGVGLMHIGKDEALAKLVLPPSVGDISDKFVLHPSMMVSALQASVVFMMEMDDTVLSRTLLLVKLKELEIYNTYSPNMWAYIRYSKDCGTESEEKDVDIDLCDEQGNICVRMRGCSFGTQAYETVHDGASKDISTLMFGSYWEETDITCEDSLHDYTEHIVFLCGNQDMDCTDIESGIKSVRCLPVQFGQDNTGKSFEDCMVQVFLEVRNTLKRKHKGKVLIQALVPLQGEQQLFTALSGLFKTAQLENSKLVCQLIRTDRLDKAEEAIEVLKQNCNDTEHRQICLQSGKRYVMKWNELKYSGEKPVIPWKDNGVYLITGGAGGLGGIFAMEMAKKVKGVTLILAGRSPNDEDKMAHMEAIEKLGARVLYRQADVTHKEASLDLIRGIVKELGKLDGIVHSAGVNYDNFIIKKTEDEFIKVLTPKVSGLINLDEASKDLPLDFFILFSSISGSMGNLGQCDYSTANAFMDAYARYRNTLAASEKRHGRTLSVGWPLWKDGGMHVDGEIEKNMREKVGLVPMQTDTGIQALYKLWALEKDHAIVMEGEAEKVRRHITGIKSGPQPSESEGKSQSVEPQKLLDRTEHQLKVVFSEITRLGVDRIDTEEPLESYGIDSVMITQLNSKLENIFTDLSKTLFYEYPTLGGLAGYLTSRYKNECIAWTGLEAKVITEPESSPMGKGSNKFPINPVKTARKLRQEPGFTGRNKKDREPIAIIGISGRFPKARNLREYWDNLKAGCDCITEIPPERWPIEGFYIPDAKEAVLKGKSYSKWGGFIDGFAEFDPLFFNISPRESMNIDPQERLFIQSCWEVLEDAGYTREQLASGYDRRVGVFAGITKTGFDLYGPDLWRQGEQIFPFTSFSSVANRISYLFNLHGPSMPVDTMCSSSLTAIHQACEYIHNGECEMAIAGGVNLYLHPSNFTGLCAQQMLSKDGRCKSFGEGGNGFVPGEGVGAVLLKSLSKAVADRDNIYALIRGTSINHGGKTNGYTVPNPVAQGELIRAALDKTGVNARTVSYIEAHGTGTELGDPIEITGLCQAFEKDTGDTGYCAIGSVKSNIGHLEAAAGIAGVAKIVLQMKNKKIVPSLHSRKLNPNINFKNTPFTVQQELSEWKRPVVEINGNIKEYPRIAGISSFGAGGSNAHIILEEYIEKDDEWQESGTLFQNPVMIVLSSRSEDRLKDQAERLLNTIRSQKISESNLAGIAYTLQVGREAMEERMAFMAASIAELEDKLEGFLEGRSDMLDFYRGQAIRNKDALAALAVDDDMEKVVDKWINKGKYSKLLEVWVKGFTFDWSKLYGSIKPRRVSLPPYPFSREQYWIKSIEGKTAVDQNIQAVVHPLLHQNTSDFSVQRFSSVFTGREFFLENHIIKGRRVLPGVAYLEMARKAAEQSMGSLIEGQVSVMLKNVAWVRPVVVEEVPVKVNIELIPQERGEADFEVYSQETEDGAKNILHSKGRVSVVALNDTPVLNIEAVQAGSSREILTPEQYYEVFKVMGIDYGPAFTGIKSVYKANEYLLAKVSLTESVKGTQEKFILHPCLIDSALQASVGFMINPGERIPSGNDLSRPLLPFALQELIIYDRCYPEMWAYISYSSNYNAGDRIKKFDIDLCDENGKVCVRLKGLSSRTLESEASSEEDRRTEGTTVSPLCLKEGSNSPDEVPDKKDSLNTNAAGTTENIYSDKLSAQNGTVDISSLQEDLLRDKTIDYLKEQVSVVIMLPSDRIEAEAPMEKYGIDSIMSMQLVSQLEKNFDSLPKTLFFEYRNLKDLSEYFIESHREKLIKLFGIKKAEEIKIEGKSKPDQTVKPLIIQSGSIAPSRFISGLKKVNEEEEPKTLDIAIIGLSGRYPKAGNVEEFWDNLRDGKDCITEIPRERWDHSLYYDENKGKIGKTYSKWGGFIDGVDRFDSLFFNISPREAEMMDPQERLFMECVYSAIEDAGYTREFLNKHCGVGLGGKVGVFVGAMYEEYQLYGAQATLMGKPVAVSGNPASIANRISYFCNFHGPSIAVDTMCSSSLTAIHLACRSLRNRECMVAVAGGVNVSIHPNKYLMHAQGNFASSKGRCESFGIGGDGYVPGEGVGAVLLKPLSKAVEDRDHIYGVIKASALNHGGKTNGYTVPNPGAQTELIEDAFREAGINPRTISYIEAHGTGTSLGDPIEIAGLSKAFGKYTRDKQFCSIGSAKSNIGHCESAAGIGGVTKVLLQLKYRQLVPSLHSKVLNPHIDFADTPFVVQQEQAEWKRPIIELNGETKEYPRIAGISSFGAGGSNAHIIIEEYIPVDEAAVKEDSSVNDEIIIVLSAKNEDRLKERVRQVLETVRKEQLDYTALTNMAYTLHVGREAMEERMALIVKSSRELEEKLERFLKEENGIKNLYRGQVERNREALAVFSGDEDLTNTVDMWIRKGKYSKLLEIWVKGMDFDWSKLYGENKPYRISLPTYPFRGERCWAPEFDSIAAGNGMVQGIITGMIHPMLHQNTSDLTEQRYTSVFTGGEFFLRDHKVIGQSVLPGAAYLEMAAAAVKQAAGIKEAGGIRLKNIVWLRTAVVADRPVEIHIGLYPEESGDIAFEIYGGLETEDSEPMVFSQGSAMPAKVCETDVLDIESLKGQCSEGIISSDQCYEAFRNLGFDYGEGHRGIDSMYCGKDFVIAKLCIPECVRDTMDSFLLHPSLLDSALQVSIGLMAGKNGSLKSDRLYLPFAMQELWIVGKCVPVMWAYMRYSESSKAADSISELDIDLCDEQGNVCVKIKGYTSRVLEDEIKSTRAENAEDTLILEPGWIEKAAANEAMESYYAEHLIFLTEKDDTLYDSIKTGVKGARCIVFQSGEKDAGKLFEECSVQIFSEIRNILGRKQNEKVLLQILIKSNNEYGIFEALSGLLKTAQLESTKVVCQLIRVEQDERQEAIIEILKDEYKNNDDVQIRYRCGKRHIMGVKELVVSGSEKVIPWKDNGVYLITGGTGGLGLIFAREIAARAKGVTLVLTGRSPSTEEKEARLKELELSGVRAVYKQADVAENVSVDNLIREIKSEFGRLNGIIHSAGVNIDNFILKKTEDEFKRVLAPKVAGLVNLDNASKDIELDFFILFSSTSGFFGNIGQADYSAANAFMDSYARYRSGLTESGQRKGLTISVNWPLWKDGGMHVDVQTERIMLQNFGMVPMQTERGIQALYKGLKYGREQLLVIEGRTVQIRKKLFGEKEAPDGQPGHVDIRPLSIEKEIDNKTVVSPDILTQKTVSFLKNEVSSVIRLSADRIETDAPMEKYGMDSILSVQIVNRLEKTFGILPKTLFFEYQNIRELSGYFIKAHRTKLTSILGMDKTTEKTEIKQEKDTVSEEPLKIVSGRRRRGRFASMYAGINEGKTADALDIAIIGLAGRYPQSADLEEFWENLRNGRDCITEIPEDRWNHSLYFDEDRDKPGKTYSKWGGFIEGVDRFDPLFFNISPREAEMIDPQERLFLECAYSTLEDAGYTRDMLSKTSGNGLGGNVGVFVGVMYEEYQLYGAQETILGKPLAVSGNPASIANRVSYFCNFHGPSIAVDTMCSSSLTAIHLACSSLIRGECRMALAGGVNVSIHPNKYLLLAQGRFASSKGRCESFGQGGDGYVPGEGVGAVMLKPLSEAIEDKDHIYGIIKASALNHGGKTNGYTVPNPNAQAEVIGKAFKEAGINPRTISYIEAHGTGTSLGDPIEIAGLNKAFEEYTEEKQFCAIGSAKSNIGHCESAAGIAGLTKILLQMKYGQIAPSIHSGILNPYIDFADSPFVVQQELAEWKRPCIRLNGEVREYPRIAGISAFGAGGANAHIVVQEYLPKNKNSFETVGIANDKAIVILSAKDEDRLKERVHQLLHAVEVRKFADTDLAAMAFTLQTGREAMEERLGVLVESFEELKTKLAGFLQGVDNIEDLFRGHVKRNKEVLAFISEDEDLKNAVDIWIEKGKYAKVLDIWVRGFDFDWNRLYRDGKPNRISLPAYPFKEDSYLLPDIEYIKSGKAAASGAVTFTALHPLVHRNTSDFSEQRFSSGFTGNEFFLKDHLVNGQKMLPGAAYLEMAREAIIQALGLRYENHLGMWLRDIVWTRPATVREGTLEMHVSLLREDNEQVGFEIYSISGDSMERIVHSQGTAVIGVVVEEQTLNIEGIRQQCSKGIISSEECYMKFGEMGIGYGSAHKGIEKLYLGQGMVLAKLSLPNSVSDTLKEFVLHPALTDAALQASIGLSVNSGDGIKQGLPFELQEIEIIRPCTPDMWAFISYSEGSKEEDSVNRLDIDMCDYEGNVCIRMKGFSSRFSDMEKQPVNVRSQTTDQEMERKYVLTPVWDTVQYDSSFKFPDRTDEMLVIGGTGENWREIRRYYPDIRILEIQDETTDEICVKLEASGSISHIIWIAPGSSVSKITDEAMIKEQNKGVIQIFRLVKALLKLGYGTKDLSLSFITVKTLKIHISDMVNPVHAGIEGLIGSMAKEYDNWEIRLMDIDHDCGFPVPDIFTVPADPMGNPYVYRLGEWYRQKLIPASCGCYCQTLYKKGGVYVVIGGSGGIGQVWSQYMSRTYGARIVWIGRREKDKDIQKKIDSVVALGPEPYYISADASDSKSLQKAYKEIKKRYPEINGIVHSAIVLSDKSLANMEEEKFKTVLSSKVDVSVRMAQVFKDEPLDFVLFFSSFQSFSKAPGQSNYASGCTFKDAFARQLASEWPCAVKVMNWGYWGSIGIVASKEYNDRIAKSGIGSIEPDEAMEALEMLMSTPIDQIAFIKTTKPLDMEGIDMDETFVVYPEDFTSSVRSIQDKVLTVLKPFKLPEPIEHIGHKDTGRPVEKVRELLVEIVSRILQVKGDDIDVFAEFSDFGFDLIMQVELIKELNREFNIELMSGDVYDRNTLDNLAGYLLEKCKEVLKSGGIEYQQRKEMNS